MMLQQFFLFATVPKVCDQSFLGLTSWYHYLPASDFDGNCNIKHFHFLSGATPGGDISLILLAVVDDLLRIAGIAAVGFVVYGAIQYIASQGSPEATAKAQSTIINALIGMAVAVASIAFISFLANKLGGSPAAAATGPGISPGNLPQVGAGTNPNPIPIVLDIAFGIAGALAVLMITISGLRYITSAGNPEKTSRAKNGIVYSMVGLVIAIAAEAIVSFVGNRL